jgi:predicted MFS family arabinose efflux permease
MRIGAILVFALISEVARRQLLTFLVLEFALDSVAKAVVLADCLLLLFFR